MLQGFVCEPGILGAICPHIWVNLVATQHFPPISKVYFASKSGTIDLNSVSYRPLRRELFMYIQNVPCPVHFYIVVLVCEQVEWLISSSLSRYDG